MIIKILKFIIGILIFILFIGLLLITFNGSQKTNKAINFEEISIKENIAKKINKFDTIYSKNKYNIEKKGNKINIKLDKGDFIMNFNDLSKKYSISSTGFYIDLNVPGDVYVSTKKDNTIILSINSIINIDFLDSKNNKINSIIIYPHEYFIFDSKKTKYYFKKADIYRLRILNIVKNKHKSTYIKEKLNNITFNDISNIMDEENYKLFQTFINDKKKLLDINKKNYQKLLETNITGTDFINFLKRNQKYFLNDRKKIIFIKNEIYNKSILLFKKNNFSLDKVNELIKLKKELKILDRQAYDEINNFINNIYYTLLLNNNITNYKKLENFLYLKEGKKNLLVDSNFLNLKRIYINYDYFNFGNTKKYFKEFLDTYLKKSGIVTKDNKFILQNEKNINKLKSFLFYLKEYVYAHLYDDLDIKLDNKILSKYFSLNRMIYFSGEANETKIKTSLMENEIILKKITIFLRNNFFEEKRENNILVLNKKHVDFNEILALEKEIDKIIKVFNKYEYILQDEEKEEFNNIFKDFKEFFYALKDYNSYYVEKNKEIQKLLNVKGLGETTKKIYDKNYIIKYFSKFRGVNFNKNNIEKKDDYFIIKNIGIYNKKYNFNLYPESGFKLDIYDLNNKFLFSFNLKQQEFLWNKKFKESSGEEKKKYDFRNFFLEKFKNNTNYIKNSNIKEFCKMQNKDYDPIKNKCIEKENDSPLIASFKQNKLLIDEFSAVKDFFKVKYENLYVKQKNDGGFDIKLKNVVVVLSLNKNGLKDKFTIYLDGNYNLQDHSLSNISLKVKQKDKLMFDGNYIIFSKFKKVKILELNKFLKNFLENNLILYKGVFNVIRSQYLIKNLSINYYFGRTTFNFVINSKNVKIKFDNYKILSIIIGDKELLQDPIKFSQLNDYINKF